MKTVVCAVNRPVGDWRPKAALAEGDSPSAWHLYDMNFADADAPRFVITALF